MFLQASGDRFLVFTMIRYVFLWRRSEVLADDIEL